jgi:FKBP-type peptidyl-prolyl cis-trans isomerase
MPKSGVKIISEEIGSGVELKKGNRVRVKYDIQLNKGDYLAQGQESIFLVGSREMVAGFRYGLEGIKVGGKRKFRASPHLCYRDLELERIPKNAVLIFDVKEVEILPSA